MVRDTSAECYALLMQSGAISKQEKDVVSILRDEGKPITGNMVARRMVERFGYDPIDISRGALARITSLKRKGVVCEVEKGECPESKKQAYFVTLTGEQPRKLETDIADEVEAQVAKLKRLYGELERLQARVAKEEIALLLLTDDHCSKCKSLNVKRLALAPALVCDDCGATTNA